MGLPAGGHGEGGDSEQSELFVCLNEMTQTETTS